jgi:hypothetical protein
VDTALTTFSDIGGRKRSIVNLGTLTAEARLAVGRHDAP